MDESSQSGENTETEPGDKDKIDPGQKQDLVDQTQLQGPREASEEDFIDLSPKAKTKSEAEAEAESDDVDIEANKRVSETEPEELAQALRQVFNGGEEKGPLQSIAIANTSRERDRGQKKIGQHDQDASADSIGLLPGQTAAVSLSSEVESKSGYTNPLALFADVFYGVLIAPRQTLFILSNSAKFPANRGNLFLTFSLVFIALALPAFLKIGTTSDLVEGLLKALVFILTNLVDWAILAFVLYYLSNWLRGHKLTLGNAFIATGWAYLPFAFFAPVACFKTLLGPAFIAFACLPALWFIALQWLAFQTSLRTTPIKLAMIALVVPPIFCLVYLFWIGLALLCLIGQLLNHLT